jgi:hypothetical protein
MASQEMINALSSRAGGAPKPAAQLTSGSGDAMVDVLRPIDENSLSWLSQQPVGRMPPRPVEEVMPYRQSPYQRIGNFALDAMQGAGMDRYAAHTLRGQLFGAQGDKGRGIGVADFVPGLDVLSAIEGYNEARGPFGRGLAGLGTIASIIPVIGGPAAKGLRKLGGAIDDVVSPSYSKSLFDIDQSAPASRTPLAASSGAGDAGGGGRGLAAVPDLRRMSLEEAITVARGEPHILLNKDKTQMIGAPRGMSTRRQLNAARRSFDADVALGVSGAKWYDRGRAFFNRVAGGGNRSSRAAQIAAATSPQATPETNLIFALQGNNAMAAGRPLDKVRTGQQADLVNTFADSYRPSARNARETLDGVVGAGDNQGPPIDEDIIPQRLALGKKTRVYGDNLDPTVPMSTTGTNDIWHGRSWGFTNSDGSLFSRALSSQEHKWLDFETTLAVDRANATNLGGRSDWTAAQIQASAWVAKKGAAIAAQKGIPLDEGIALASREYTEAAPANTLSVTHEQIPGRSTGLLGDIINAPYAEKERFSNAASWADKEGRDRLYSEMGLWTLPDRRGPGAFVNSADELEVNPVTVTRPLIDYQPGGKTMSETTQAGVDTAETWRGLLDFQEGSAANKIETAAKGGPTSRSNVAVNVEGTPTIDQMERIARLAKKHGFGVANNDTGVTLIDEVGDRTFGDVGKELKKGLAREIEEIFPGATVERGGLSGTYIDRADLLAKENEGKGLATKQAVDALMDLRTKAPLFYDSLVASEGMSSKARQNLDRLYKEGGRGQRKDYETLLGIVGEGGIKSLLSRIEMLGYAGLPAVGGAAVLGHGIWGRQDSTQPEG